MPALSGYTLHAVGINATIIDQITSRDFQLNPTIVSQINDGQVDPRWVSNFGVAPRGTFTTRGISKALTAAGISGVAITTGVDFEFQKLLAGGTRDSSGHVGITYATAIVAPTRLVAEQDDYATIEYEVAAYSATAGAAPHSINVAYTLSGAPGTTEGFTLGAVTLAGTALKGVKRYEVDFGIRIEQEKADGESFPRLVYIADRNPRITVELLDIGALTGTNFQTGQSVSGAPNDIVCTLLSMAQGGGPGSAGVTLTMEQGMIVVEDGGGEIDANTQSLSITPTSDGVADIIVVS